MSIAGHKFWDDKIFDNLTKIFLELGRKITILQIIICFRMDIHTLFDRYEIGINPDVCISAILFKIYLIILVLGLRGL